MDCWLSDYQCTVGGDGRSGVVRRILTIQQPQCTERDRAARASDGRGAAPAARGTGIGASGSATPDPRPAALRAVYRIVLYHVCASDTRAADKNNSVRCGARTAV